MTDHHAQEDPGLLLKELHEAFRSLDRCEQRENELRRKYREERGKSATWRAWQASRKDTVEALKRARKLEREQNDPKRYPLFPPQTQRTAEQVQPQSPRGEANAHAQAVVERARQATEGKPRPRPKAGTKRAEHRLERADARRKEREKPEPEPVREPMILTGSFGFPAPLIAIQSEGCPNPHCAKPFSNDGHALDEPPCASCGCQEPPVKRLLHVRDQLHQALFTFLAASSYWTLVRREPTDQAIVCVLRELWVKRHGDPVMSNPSLPWQPTIGVPSLNTPGWWIQGGNTPAFWQAGARPPAAPTFMGPALIAAVRAVLELGPAPPRESSSKRSRGARASKSDADQATAAL